jgi:4-hydroxy-3-polyprenylbenzoate decarboxylase
VLEGYIAKDELTEEGPFGDHTGYYTPPEPFPVFHVTAMTMRRDAIYPSIVVGKPPQEDAWLGKATERIFLPAIRMSVPRSSTTTCRSLAPSTTAASSRSARAIRARRRR